MAKYSVNLILAKQKESDISVRLKIVFPLIALSVLIIFIICFGLTVLYLNVNAARFNQIKREVSTLENKISSQKEIEGIYTLSYSRLNILDQLLSVSSTFTKILAEINDMNSDNIRINTLGIDSKGNLNLSMIASSSADLDDLVALFTGREDKKLFSNINASGISREKKGEYHLGINLNTNKTLLE